ncbi:MAG: DUF1109 family protein [Rhodospirillales bacterium]|jgi:hypothetical protein|nr:DUF1109 family protein [Rhodospirillales bacterium]
METERLVAQLTAGLEPVRRLPSPEARLGRWLLASVPAAGVVAVVSGLRPDLAARLADPGFLTEVAAAALTATVGTYAALCAGLPDQPGWKLWLPLAPMLLWLGTLGHQCMDTLLHYGPQGLTLTADAMCLPSIALAGLVPAIAITLMLRRGGQFRRTNACLCGGLGAAALGGAALRLFHPVDAAIMVIVWQLGSVALLSLVAGLIGRVLIGMSDQHARFVPGG